MNTRTILNRLSALFLTLPTIGLLFAFVPWESDPRVESASKRYERLKHPRDAYLVDVLVNVHEMYLTGPHWDGLFAWQEAELRELTAEREAVERDSNY